jgi:hypothetical protein
MAVLLCILWVLLVEGRRRGNRWTVRTFANLAAVLIIALRIGTNTKPVVQSAFLGFGRSGGGDESEQKIK